LGNGWEGIGYWAGIGYVLGRDATLYWIWVGRDCVGIVLDRVGVEGSDGVWMGAWMVLGFGCG